MSTTEGGKPLEATYYDRRCPRCGVGYMMAGSITPPAAYSCGHLGMDVETHQLAGRTVVTCCPRCLGIHPRLIQDVAGSLVASCATCGQHWAVCE